MKKLITLPFFLGLFTVNAQTCNLLSHDCSSTTGLNTSGISSNGGSTIACTLANTVLYSSGTNAYIATDDIQVGQGNAVTLNFEAKKASSYFGTCEVWVHVGGFCSFQVYTSPFNTNGWVQIGSFNPSTICSNFDSFTVPSDIAGGMKISYCIVLKNASSSNWVSIDNICVSEIAGSGVPTSYNETFGTSSSGWYPNAGYVDIPYHTYKNASDAYVLLGSGEGSFPDKAAYFYTGFDFCSTVSGTGIITREINTSGFSNGEVRLSFKSQYPCSGPPGYTFDEDYTSYSPEVYIMEGPDDGTNPWIQLPVNYYFADYNWRVASYDISAYKNANVRFKIERGGFCSSAMEAVDNLKVIDRDCSISLESCGTITGETAPLQNTDYPYTVPALSGATYYKWLVRYEGNLYDASPYIVSGQGTQNAMINFNSLPSTGARVLCIPYDTDPSADPDACYAQIGYLGVSVSAVTPLTVNNVDSVDITCNGFNDGSITLTVSGGQPSYTYTWVPNVSSSNSATGLSPGNYEITVEDQNADQVIIDVQISEPAPTIADFFFDDYCFNDVDPLPTYFNGGSSGTFSSTPAGLSINSSTGLIDLDASTPGTYTVTNTISIAGCPTVSSNDDITIFELPNATIIGSATVCPGEPSPDVIFNLTAGTPVWDLVYNLDGSPINVFGISSNPFTIPGAPGTYELVSITDGNGCSNILSGQVIQSEYQTPVMDPITDIEGCKNDNINVPSFSSTPAGSTYSWTNTTGFDIGFGLSGSGDIGSFTAQNGTGSTVTVTVETYAISLEGCVGVPINFNVSIHPSPEVQLGPDFSTCDSVETLDAGSGAISYDWSTAATTQSIDITSSDEYIVVITDINGCTNSDSIYVTFTDCNGIESFTESDLVVYPNPVRDKLQLINIPSNTMLSIYDLRGKVIYNEKINCTQVVIKTDDWSQGIYILTIESGQNTIHKKIEKI